MYDKAVLGLVALVAAGALALGRRGVLPQVAGRSVAWLVLLPASVGVAEAARWGHLPDARTALFAASSTLALLLARPALHTPEARAEFAPVRHRRLFLAGAVAAGMTGLSAALFAVGAMLWGAPGAAVGIGLLGASLMASAYGVVRMRAWGVLLAMVASVGAVGAALLNGNHGEALALALASLPGMLLASPIALAKLGWEPRVGRAVSSPPVQTLTSAAALRVADDDVPPVRARVDAGHDGDGATDALAPRAHAAAHST